MSAESLTIAGLEEWVLLGASWRVVDISARRVVVDLCACTGEPMQRVSSQDRAVIDYLHIASTDRDRDRNQGDRR